MGSGMEMVKRDSSKKGYLTLAASAATVGMFFFGFWYLGILGLVASGFFGYQWFKHRGKWGLRF